VGGGGMILTTTGPELPDREGPGRCLEEAEPESGLGGEKGGDPGTICM